MNMGDEIVKKNKYEIDMCNGSIMDKLISFSLPLMLSGILQLMFNAVDIVVVGRFSGSEALAAVGSTTALINVFTNLFIGICGMRTLSPSPNYWPRSRTMAYMKWRIYGKKNLRQTALFCKLLTERW